MTPSICLPQQWESICFCRACFYPRLFHAFLEDSTFLQSPFRTPTLWHQCPPSNLPLMANSVLMSQPDSGPLAFTRKILTECHDFLNTLQLPVISEQQKSDCDKALTMNGKFPGNDGLSVEFCKCFWDDIKTVFFSSVCYSRTVGELFSSQKQAIMKLIEKKTRISVT